MVVPSKVLSTIEMRLNKYFLFFFLSQFLFYFPLGIKLCTIIKITR